MGRDLPKMAGNDFVTDGQPYAVAFEYAPGMQALERTKDSSRVLFVESDAVVDHMDLPGCGRALRTEFFCTEAGFGGDRSSPQAVWF
jgi:hypothetical protein